jgi:hypothetical protein
MNIFRRLPEEVIINNIIPFLYKPQPKDLLLDIRSFYTDFHLLDNYRFYYNTHCLYNDIIDFIDLENLLVRHYNCKDLTGYSLTLYIITTFHVYGMKNISSKNRMLWGLMTPIERTRFFNKYVIDDEND